MYTGEDDPENIGKIHTWNNETRTHYPAECGEIRGSAGGFFPPHTSSHELELFSHEACRTLTYRTNGQMAAVNGIDGIVYELPPAETFANGSVYPPNWCYSNHLPSGLHNASYCKTDRSPLFLSFPHFLGADPFFRRKFHHDSHLNPDEKRHSSRIVFQPVSRAIIIKDFFIILEASFWLFQVMGIPLQFLLRLQINMRLHPNPGIR